jgi:hypothetical protein
MVVDTERYYNEITSTISLANLHLWEKSIMNAENNRLKNPAVMDILGAGVADSGTKIPVTSIIVATDGERWIELALVLEEMQ